MSIKRQIPSVPYVNNAQLQNFLSALREAVNSSLGTDSAVSTQQVVQNGTFVYISESSALAFTATDGVVDSSNPTITLTAHVSGLTTPTYQWTFNGFTTSPVDSGTNTQTITPTQFGTAKSAIVTCTVNGIYFSTVTIVQLNTDTKPSINFDLGTTSASTTLNRSIGSKVLIQCFSTVHGTNTNSPVLTLNIDGAPVKTISGGVVVTAGDTYDLTLATSYLFTTTATNHTYSLAITGATSVSDTTISVIGL